MTRVQGKVAIVTGGAAGLGAAIVRRLVSEGAKVIVTDIQNDAGHALAGEFMKSLSLRSMSLCLAIFGAAYIVSRPVFSADHPYGADRVYSSSFAYENVMIPMRDGVRLATDVYLPSIDGVAPAPGRFSVLLMRTPYGKKHVSDLSAAPFVASVSVLSQPTANSQGYAMVYQDVRGTFDSEGTFKPMLNEGNDGFDAVEWLRKQPWSDGRVATFGPSYLGGDQMLLAAERPAGLVTAFSQVAATDQFRNDWVYMDGVLALTTAARWTLGMVGGAVSRLPETEQESLRADYAALGIADPAAMSPKTVDTIINALPLKDMPIVRHAPWWPAWLNNWDNPSHFENNEMESRFAKISVPILHLGGWYDLFIRNTYEDYENISDQATTAVARANQRLVIGPWSHGTCAECAPNADVDAGAMQLAWMDQWFKNKKHPIFDYPVVLYIMGENRWRAEESWPLNGTVQTRYYLHSLGRANSASGNGKLSTQKPKIEKPDNYTYDPRTPTPTIGGIGCYDSPGRADQSAVERRSDVLAFTSQALTEDVEVTGEVQATLYAASSAKDTDWWAQLVDVGPDGKAYILNHGVVRARYRLSRANLEPLAPGRIEKYKINMWATGNVFKKGHSIRLDVTSSNFPYSDRNPNAFVDLASATDKDYVVARQTIYHDADHASYVELPIIPRSRARRWIDTPFARLKDSAVSR